MKKLLLYLLFLISAAAQAQKISGTVLDEKSEPLPFANVLLMNAADTSLVKANASDMMGKFEFEAIKDGAYFLEISMVGYTAQKTPKFIINEATKNLEFNGLKLQLQANELAEVKVLAKKPFVEQQLDKTVVNVEGSIVASGNTLLEVLEKSPGVTLDRQNNNIKLRNKDGVQIMIDGRRSYLSNEALMQFLSNLNADQVVSIEIITNPSSKYDASGNSGIINIKLKKNQAFGTNGTVTVNLGEGFLPNATSDLVSSSVNLNLNHRNEKWNVFGNVSPGRNAFYSDNNLLRSTNFEGLRSEFNQSSYRTGNGVFLNGKVGADYFVNTKTTLGVMFDMNRYNGTMKSTGLTEIKEINNGLVNSSSLIPDADRTNESQNYTANFNLKHNFNEKGKEMTFDLDYSGFRNDALQNFDTKYFDGLGKPTSSLIQRNSTPSFIDIYAARLDFVIPQENQVKLEFGAKTSYVKTDNDFIFEQRIDNNWVKDMGKTNHFIYTEFVNAAYVNLGRQWKKIGLQSGLRLEHTKSLGNSLTLDKKVPKNYLSAFPTLFINQPINQTHSMRYSYSRRIGRPNYQQLNPFLFFLDPYTFQKGNEFLTPQFTDNAEVTYSYKGAASLSLGYGYTKDNMFDVIEQDDASRVTFQTTKNLEKVKNYSANLSFPIPVRKWWNMHNNFSLYYTRYQDPNVNGGVLDVGQLAYNFYTGSTFSFKKGWSAEANMWFNSPNVYGIIKSVKPQYAVNVGAQKTILDKKGKIKLNVSDLFLTSFFNGKIDYQNVDLAITNRWNARRANLSFSYNFGNQNVKASRRRGTATDDLKQRAGGNQN